MTGLSLMLPLLLGFSPFLKGDPLVVDGTARYKRGDFEGAREKFEAAKARHPNDAEVAYDLGLALFKLEKHEEAEAALRRALSLDTKQQLTSKIQYNLGNVLAARKKDKEAMAEYRAALRVEPSANEARHNYEVLLRRIPPPTPDGGSDAGSDAGSDGGSDGGINGGSDAGNDGGSQGDKGQSDGGKENQQGTAQDGGGKDQRDQPPKSADGGQGDKQPPKKNDASPANLVDGGLSQKEAERLLDAVDAQDEAIQSWRFQLKEKGKDSNGKDW